MPTGDGSSSSMRSSSSGRRLLSRIASPFAAKSRSVPEFYVEIDDPYRRYSAGDTVSGTVVFKAVKAVRVTHIVVCLHGHVQVYKNPGAPPAEGFRAFNQLSGKGRTRNTGGEYFGNGFHSLFEDELVVCGDGRLDEGGYKFRFERTFPRTQLPTSVDFERGTISYMITATMTKPTSISPITYHDHKIFFVERIETSRLLPPKARTITLEPLVKRSRTRTNTKRRTNPVESLRSQGDQSTPGTPRQNSSLSLPRTPTEERPRSPSPSEQSLHSEQSSNCPTSVSGSFVHVSRGHDSSSVLSSTPGTEDRTITVTVESLKGACLRGDHVPIKINVSHTKHVKSMQGIILTLYRQARVDTHPAIPIGPMTEGQKQRTEDYYPKSLTGLGGLSLSGAGSSHVFRKDLSQSILPLIIDPRILSAEVTPKVHVPADAFPTISCVPGAMISFKYFVEIILDIQGKLAGQERYFSQSSDLAGGQSLAIGELESSYRPDPFVKSEEGRTIVDTAPIRRDKSVITCTVEVVVGTVDSQRLKGKGRAETSDFTELYAPRQLDSSTISPAMRAVTPNTQYQVARSGPGNQGYADQVDITPNSPPPQFEPPPQSASQENLSEKERLRRAEAMLTPSRPPGFQDDFASRMQPSAPVLDENDGSASYPQWNDINRQDGYEYPDHYPDEHEHDDYDTFGQPSAPSYTQHDANQGAAVGSSDHPTLTTGEDKLDLQRRYLEAQASEPPGADDEHQGHEGALGTEVSTGAFVPSEGNAASSFSERANDMTQTGDGLHERHVP